MSDVDSKTTGGFGSALGDVIKNIMAIPSDIASGGIKSIVGLIFIVLKYIFKFLYILFRYIIPFLVKYIGIPLFILGIIMALLFFGGHLFFVVALMVGVFLYIKGLYKLTFNLPKQSKDMTSTTSSGNSGNDYKVKM